MAFWSEFASAYAAQVHSLCASVTAVYLPFFVFGGVFTRLVGLRLSDDPGPSVFTNSIARPIIGLAQLNYTLVLQPRHYEIG